MMNHAQVSHVKMMNVLRESLYEHGDLVMLANRTGLSPACLYSIRSGRTKWPRLTTWEALMLTLNLRMELVKC